MMSLAMVVLVSLDTSSGLISEVVLFIGMPAIPPWFDKAASRPRFGAPAAGGMSAASQQARRLLGRWCGSREPPLTRKRRLLTVAAEARGWKLKTEDGEPENRLPIKRRRSVLHGDREHLCSVDAVHGERQRHRAAGRDVRHRDVQLVKARITGGQSVVNSLGRDSADEYLEAVCKRVGKLHELACRYVGRHRPEANAVNDDDVAGHGGPRGEAGDGTSGKHIGAVAELRNCVLDAVNAEVWRCQQAGGYSVDGDVEGGARPSRGHQDNRLDAGADIGRHQRVDLPWADVVYESGLPTDPKSTRLNSSHLGI